MSSRSWICCSCHFCAGADFLQGARRHRLPVNVKAVTLHRFRVAFRDNLWKAAVVLDFLALAIVTSTRQRKGPQRNMHGTVPAQAALEEGDFPYGERGDFQLLRYG